jgi:hypothetical protein
MVVRINQGAARHAGDSLYGHRVDVSIPFQSAHPLGLPGPEQSADLAAVEDELVPALTAEGRGALVLSITKAGVRELVFYTSTPDAVEPQLRGLSAKAQVQQPQYVLHEDAQWDFYRQFAGSTDDA